jgi:hypothetical protein
MYNCKCAVGTGEERTNFGLSESEVVDGLGMVVHACNLSYLGGGHRRIVVGGQYREKVIKTLFQRTSQPW